MMKGSITSFEMNSAIQRRALTSLTYLPRMVELDGSDQAPEVRVGEGRRVSQEVGLVLDELVGGRGHDDVLAGKVAAGIPT